MAQVLNIVLWNERPMPAYTRIKNILATPQHGLNVNYGNTPCMQKPHKKPTLGKL